jgi:hypothetical protein
VKRSDAIGAIPTYRQIAGFEVISDISKSILKYMHSLVRIFGVGMTIMAEYLTQ